MDKLVIGGGYLGQRVAALWHAAGHRVFVTTRRKDAAATYRALGYQPLLCDVLDIESLRNLPSVDAVAYAVALDRSTGQTMRDVYVEGLRHVMTQLPRPRRFVYVSSSSVYGQTDGDWIDESAVTEPREESGKIVLEAERLLADTEAIRLRFAGIYGPGRWLRKKSILAGETIVGDAEKWLNLIHVDDGATAVLAAETQGEPGRVYNVCDDEPVRRRDFYAEMARLLQVPTPTFQLPTAGSPSPPHELANRRLRNERLKSELGVTLQYPTFRAGLSSSLSRLS